MFASSARGSELPPDVMILLHVLRQILRAPSNLYRSYLYPNPSDARSDTFTDFIPRRGGAGLPLASDKLALLAQGPVLLAG